MGVHPPLELSHYQIKFAATSLYDTSVATLYVVNPHLSVNSLTHSVPRIGSGDSCPVPHSPICKANGFGNPVLQPSPTSGGSGQGGLPGGGMLS